jgi:hypothetical protein
MTSYLPRFTLRGALIAIALFALFLGWLRPDRARTYQSRKLKGPLDLYQSWKPLGPYLSVTHGLEFAPIWMSRRIVVERTRVESTGAVTYNVEFRDQTTALPQP